MNSLLNDLATRTELTTHEALSGIFGSISLASWISVFVPQLLENYLNQSAESLSITFLIVWTLADVFSLIGAIWAGLVPVVIANGVYFVFADLLLLGQYLYYGVKSRRLADFGSDNGHKSRLANDSGELGEAAHLLQPETPRNVAHAIVNEERANTDAQHTLESTVEVTKPRPGLQASDVAVMFIIAVIGSIGWAIAYKLDVWQPASSTFRGSLPKKVVGAQILGYCGTMASLASRVPQIIKNLQAKNCAGLAPLFFALSLMANLSYGASILCHSLEPEYIMKSLPWLIGSLGTCPQDVIILAQIRFYESIAKQQNRL